MKRIAYVLLAGLAMAGCNASAGVRAKAPAAPGDILIEAQWGMALNAVQRGDASMVMQALETAMSDEVYPQLSPHKKYEVAELYGRAADSLGRWGDAHRGFARASVLPGATREDWDGRLHTANSAGLAEDAWTAFEHIRSKGEPVFQTFGGREVGRFDALVGALPNAREARLAIGGELERENRSPLQGYNDESIVWAHYAEALLESGEEAHARAAAERVTDPVVMTQLAADRRFDPIVASSPKLADPQAAAEAYLAWTKSQVAAYPRQLSARIAVVRALAVLDRPEDALAYAQGTARAMAAGTADDPYFEDAPTEAQFFEGWRNSLLVRLGRGPEAVAGLTSAASCHCSEIARVELAQALLETGHAQEAQDWLADASLERLVVEDQMTLAEIRACAAAALDDRNTIENSLGILRAHRAVRPQALTHALVCANRLDEAAAELTARLTDPHDRLAALRAAQTYADPVQQPYSQQVRARWSQLLARPDVREAVDKVGRSAEFKLQARDPRA